MDTKLGKINKKETKKVWTMPQIIAELSIEKTLGTVTGASDSGIKS